MAHGDTFTIYRDVPVKTKRKGPHVRKIGGRLYGGVYLDYGDVPVCTYNDITKKFEAVVNLRGKAYGARSRFCYRRKVRG